MKLPRAIVWLGILCGVLLAGYSGWLAYVLWYINEHGQMIAQEPTAWIRYVEMVGFPLSGLLGIALMLAIAWHD